MYLYQLLKEKHLHGIFSKRPKAIGQILEDKTDDFENLSLEKQVQVLLQILKISSKVNQGADLRELGESKTTGYSRISKIVTSENHVYIVNQSVTGLYKSKIDLLTV